MRHLISIAAAACAVAALSACTAAVEPPAQSPSTASASTPAGSPAATASAGTKPATVTKSPPAPKPPTTAWKSIDWKPITNGEMPDCPQKTEVDSVHYADLTGDGLTEAIVAAACWTDTSQNPINIFIYDGADRRPPLARLVTIGKDQYLKTAEVRTSGATVTVTSKALSDDAPRCCPDLLITQKYAWRDGAFHQVSLVEKPL